MYGASHTLRLSLAVPMMLYLWQGSWESRVLTFKHLVCVTHGACAHHVSHVPLLVQLHRHPLARLGLSVPVQVIREYKGNEHSNVRK